MLQTKITTPESQGIASEHILHMIKRLEKHQIPMHSILIARNDQLLYEGYYKPYHKTKQHRMFSISKTMTALAIGHLITKGTLRLDDHIADYFPEKCPPDLHPWIQAMTIRNMLEMRSCHSSTTYKADLQSDWVSSFFTAVPDHPAGTVFHYDTSSPHVLCALVEKLTGKPMLTYLKEEVLQDLALSGDSYMLTDPFGVSMGGSGLCCTSMDMLKLGQFLLHKGCINGRQIIDASYMEAATSHINPTIVKAPLPSEAQGYGYQIWQNERGGCVAYGMGGQLVIVIPQYQLVCVTTADTQGYGGGNQVIYDAFYEEVLDKICNTSLAPDPEAYEVLLHYSEHLSLPVVKGSFSSPMADNVNNLSYSLLENKAGFTTAALSLDNEAGTGTLALDDFQIHFGLGQLTQGTLPLCNQYYVASGAWLKEDTLYIKGHICDECVGSIHIQLHFAGNQITVYLRIIEEMLSKSLPGGHFVGYSQRTDTP